jgi:hypothetical protein
VNALAVVGIALLALIVGISIGTWLTGRRYQQSLGQVHDITNWAQGRSRDA